ncbi:hypothetical protein SOVF_042700 [Spinacia oleracea]|uniref:F-box protein At3g24700 n=1 Tax=Spinacia oleracea TaxID=3562 RepID=A0ABM3RNK4_SPIOL|nr:putative F-box protein At3g24700 [Spinacia oleracea]KNA21493.1 hypothetical protein SOVF_042700 [Spinacia oleracea]
MVKKLQLKWSGIEELPSPIISDILSRLPTKACLICKLVCKDWNSIIKDPLFPDSRRSRGCYSTLLLWGDFNNNGRRSFLVLDIDKRLNVDEMGNLNVSPDEMIGYQTKFRVKNDSLKNLVNECKGVILFDSFMVQGPYVVCNLLTGQHVVIKQRRRPGYDLQVSGLGYCPVSNKFKILRILKVKGVYVAEIQTIGTDKWRPVVDELPINCWEPMHNMVFFNSSLHGYSCSTTCIWSFHFGKEEFSSGALHYPIKYNSPIIFAGILL